MEVFYGGTSLELLIFLRCLWSHQQNMWSLITWVVFALSFFVKTIIDDYIWFTIKGTNSCDPSVCFRGWGPVSCLPPYYQLAALVLLPAFLWRGAAWSHHLCGILYREQPWQPGKQALRVQPRHWRSSIKTVFNFHIHEFKWRLLCLLC